MNTSRLLLVTSLSLVTLSLIGCSGAQQAPPGRPPVTVTVAQPVKKKIVEWDAYTGRLEPIEFVEIRARVSGYLQSIHFDEGQIVNEGDLLFVIDPRPFEADLDAAKAAMAQAQSQLQQANAGMGEAKARQLQADAEVQLADARLKRTRTLMQRNATSDEELDQREAEYLQAKANTEAARAGIQSAQAMIETAKAAIQAAQAGIETSTLNLDYSRITAPVTGRISREYVTEGNLINGGTTSSTLLTTITSVDPIYCTFDANEQEVLKYIRLAMSGERQSSRVAKNPVFLGLVDETGFPHRGHMDFVDNRFDVDTASMRARCVLDNEDQVLLPGMFARIRIPGSAAYEAVLIPDSAIGTDQASQYVYIVDDSIVQRRAVTVGPVVDGLRVVRSGLSGDETLVIEGLLQARPDMKVETVEGTVEVVEDGLPDDYQTIPKEEWLTPDPDAQSGTALHVPATGDFS
ncbi:efflux RND transporter periplasmic adaptor subunit [Aporhodopirellula aestuarii]|uniref:Efflux RND transporter periplasmic adaptor subunit n=1 Tax=Aporhodopirellula aestuarii TaxID=2950107 RepID=A0ABT0U6I6_9BACT|nr:efflux RND transporter periplasmic adaptor subunit [Aporhodopirellula aestuarii]MCM2371936.1 efflux RND transporter periplasmic adaptor subunit [Aporhodopirellula aestuarii]